MGEVVLVALDRMKSGHGEHSTTLNQHVLDCFARFYQLDARRQCRLNEAVTNELNAKCIAVVVVPLALIVRMQQPYPGDSK